MYLFTILYNSFIMVMQMQWKYTQKDIGKMISLTRKCPPKSLQ